MGLASLWAIKGTGVKALEETEKLFDETTAVEVEGVLCEAEGVLLLGAAQLVTKREMKTH
ncbi:hypothetical protein [Bdellovibrio sp. HCB2-146]|uniref:hypothetical protein n=1 Tax=Bdellovibrio sp. HCB2-146 TaxID=3394362 RepID=UPI0039BD60FE